MTLAIPVGEETQAVTISPRAEALRLSLRTNDPAEVKSRQAAVDAHLVGQKEERQVPKIGLVKLPNYPEPRGGAFDSASETIQLLAAVPLRQSVLLQPGERAVIPTGLAVQLPENWEGQIVSLNGLVQKHGIAVLNRPGTIDPDYRGEVMVILINHGVMPTRIKRGMPIADLKFRQFIRAELVENNVGARKKAGRVRHEDELSSTTRTKLGWPFRQPPKHRKKALKHR